MAEEYLKGLIRFEKDELLLKRLPKLIELWKQTFPGIDIKGEIQGAHYWLQMHGKWKKRNDIYIGNWIKKAYQFKQEKPTFGKLPKYVEQKPEPEEIMSGEDFGEMRKAIRQGLK